MVNCLIMCKEQSFKTKEQRSGHIAQHRKKRTVEAKVSKAFIDLRSKKNQRESVDQCLQQKKMNELKRQKME